MVFVALKFDCLCSLIFKQKESQKNEKDLKMLAKEVSSTFNLLKSKCNIMEKELHIVKRQGFCCYLRSHIVRHMYHPGQYLQGNQSLAWIPYFRAWLSMWYAICQLSKGWIQDNLLHEKRITKINMLVYYNYMWIKY